MLLGPARRAQGGCTVGRPISFAALAATLLLALPFATHAAGLGRLNVLSSLCQPPPGRAAPAGRGLAPSAAGPAPAARGGPMEAKPMTPTPGEAPAPGEVKPAAPMTTAPARAPAAAAPSAPSAAAASTYEVRK